MVFGDLKYKKIKIEQMDLMDKNAQFEHKSEKLTKNDKLKAESTEKDNLILEKILQFYWPQHYRC